MWSLISLIVLPYHNYALLADIFYIITFFDRGALYCSSKNLYTTFSHVTPFCVISGKNNEKHYNYAVVSCSFVWQQRSVKVYNYITRYGTGVQHSLYCIVVVHADSCPFLEDMVPHQRSTQRGKAPHQVHPHCQCLHRSGNTIDPTDSTDVKLCETCEH